MKTGPVEQQVSQQRLNRSWHTVLQAVRTTDELDKAKKLEPRPRHCPPPQRAASVNQPSVDKEASDIYWKFREPSKTKGFRILWIFYWYEHATQWPQGCVYDAIRRNLVLSTRERAFTRSHSKLDTREPLCNQKMVFRPTNGMTGTIRIGTDTIDRKANCVCSRSNFTAIAPVD